MIEDENDIRVARSQLRGVLRSFRRAGVQTVTSSDLQEKLADMYRIRGVSPSSPRALSVATRLLRAEGAITRRVLRRADPNFYEVTETTVMYDIAPKPKTNSSRPS